MNHTDLAPWTALYNEIYPFGHFAIFATSLAAAFCTRWEAILVRTAVIFISVWLTVELVFDLSLYVEGAPTVFWTAVVMSFAYFAFCIVTCFCPLPSGKIAASIHSLGPAAFGWVRIFCIKWPTAEILTYMLETLPLILLWVKLSKIRAEQTRP